MITATATATVTVTGLPTHGTVDDSRRGREAQRRGARRNLSRHARTASAPRLPAAHAGNGAKRPGGIPGGLPHRPTTGFSCAFRPSPETAALELTLPGSTVKLDGLEALMVVIVSTLIKNRAFLAKPRRRLGTGDAGTGLGSIMTGHRAAPLRRVQTAPNPPRSCYPATVSPASASRIGLPHRSPDQASTPRTTP
jgi:hypothetical protein